MVGLYRDLDGENITVTAVTTEQSDEVIVLRQRINELELTIKQHVHVSV